MEEYGFGLERRWFERVGYYFERDQFDFTIPPSKRTLAQKFELSCLVALSDLKKMGFYNTTKENAFLTSSLFQSLKDQPDNTMNGAIFALLGVSYQPATNRWTDGPSSSSSSPANPLRKWIEMVRDPPSHDFGQFCKRYGITVPDTLRYIVYMDNRLRALRDNDRS